MTSTPNMTSTAKSAKPEKEQQRFPVSMPRFRSFLPDGSGGYREASGPADMRQINARLIRAALGSPAATKREER